MVIVSRSQKLLREERRFAISRAVNILMKYPSIKKHKERIIKIESEKFKEIVNSFKRSLL